MKNSFFVAAVQLNPGKNISENIRKVAKGISNLSKQGAEIVVLPELFIYRGDPGYYKNIAENIGGPITTFFCNLAKNLHINIILGSIIEKSSRPRKYYDTAVCISSSGEIISSYRKINLFEVKLGRKIIREGDFFLPGKKISTFTVSGRSVGVAICFDLRFASLFQSLASEGVEIICVPSNFTYSTGRAHWHVLLRNRAVETQSYIIAANCCGTDTYSRIRSFGHSIIIDPWGNIIKEAAEREALISARLDFDFLRSVREKLPLTLT